MCIWPLDLVLIWICSTFFGWKAGKQNLYNKFQDSGRYISFLVVEVEINNREEFRVPKTSLLFWLKQTSGHIRITKISLASYADYNLILIYLFSVTSLFSKDKMKYWTRQYKKETLVDNQSTTLVLRPCGTETCHWLLQHGTARGLHSMFQLCVRWLTTPSQTSSELIPALSKKVFQGVLQKVLLGDIYGTCGDQFKPSVSYIYALLSIVIAITHAIL